MNIFVSSTDPKQAAQWLDDKRVRHMPKECYELLVMAIHKRTGDIVGPFIIWDVERRRQLDHYNHPCTNWTARSRANIQWLWEHSMALLVEFQYRTDQRHWLKDDFIAISHFIPSSSRSPISYRNSSGFNKHKDITLNYQESLAYKWIHTDIIEPVWTKRGEPPWLNKHKLIQKHINFNNNGRIAL